ncbi:hypothetical protein GGR28_001250 [Lewinella aquimaris]|uniref:Uncharacterized protein n=1 Tax=Neolewinella aquimaris TaxID=1835722 RepID=A0A840E624_9BACT|nr:DUF6338 family protein [Neolewinella aquimaris]MBB4078637.1 hypothetical protein [Neolewinella aquimaris]
MNFAVGALFIVLLLLPGIALRYAYIRSNSIRRSLNFSLLSEAIIMLITSLLLHSAGMAVVRLLGSDPNLRLIYLLSTGGDLQAADYANFEAGYHGFVVYLLLLCAAAATIGYYLQQWVIRTGYEKDHKALQVFNDWDRYFNGYVLTNEQRQRLHFIRVDLLVDGGGKLVVYTGALDAYTLNGEQNIDQLFISSAIRRDNLKITGSRDHPWQPSPHTTYEMKGDYLVIPFSQVKNLNIVYVYFTEEPAAPPPSPSFPPTGQSFDLD